MKKERKRQIKKYDLYSPDKKEHYGVFKIHGKIAVDAKRLYKLELIDATQLEYINKQQRNTKYFYPQKDDYCKSIFYFFDSHLNWLRNLWNEEYEPLSNKILTPKEYADLQQAKRYVNIKSFDDTEMFELLKILDIHERNKRYYYALRLFYVQYFILYYAIAENLTTKVFNECCHVKEKVFNNKKKEILEKEGITLVNDLEYESLRKLYNLIKHGSKDSKVDYKNDKVFS